MSTAEPQLLRSAGSECGLYQRTSTLWYNSIKRVAQKSTVVAPAYGLDALDALSSEARFPSVLASLPFDLTFFDRLAAIIATLASFVVLLVLEEKAWPFTQLGVMANNSGKSIAARALALAFVVETGLR